MKRLLFSLLFALPAAILLSSCVNDGLSDCNSGVRVYFSYDFPSSYDVSSIEVSRINLLVFEEAGLYVGEWVDENVVFNSDYYMTLPLRSGVYRFVVYGNLTTPYSLTPSSPVKGETSFNAMTMNLSSRSDGAVTATLSRLYHGYLTDAAIKASEADQRFSIPLAESTNRIHVTVEGLGEPDKAYRLRIDDTNGDYALDNSFASTRSLFYSALCSRAGLGTTQEASFTVLRLKRDRRHAVLSLREETSDAVLYEENLIDLILMAETKGATINFDKTNDYYVTLRFNADMSVTVTINGWDVTSEQSGPIS